MEKSTAKEEKAAWGIEKEVIYLYISQGNPLRGSRCILHSAGKGCTGRINEQNPVSRWEDGEKGVRDPFIVRSVIDGKFYIIATDLRIANGKGWTAAQMEGSTKIVIWCSKDLVHWSEPWTFETGVPGAGCAWAPEAV